MVSNAKSWRDIEWRWLYPEKAKAQNRRRVEWGRLNPERGRVAKRRSRYGLTSEMYEGLMMLQDGVCAICRDPGARSKGGDGLAVDHDHETGEVRGLLCDACNTAIGLLKDDPQRLQQAIHYLGGLK